MKVKRNQEELNKMLLKAIEQVESQGIKVGIVDLELHLTNATKQLGRCTQTSRGRFIISISRYYKDADEMNLMDTLVHEVLHTVEGCQNHGSLWQSHAETLNKAFGYDIQRLAQVETSNLTAEHKAILQRYIIECRECGSRIYRQRKSKLVNQTDNYLCKCGGELYRVK